MSQTPVQPSNPPRSAQPRKAKGPSIWSTTLAVAVLLATLFTSFKPVGLFSGDLSDLSLLLTSAGQEGPALPGITPQPQVRIGLVAGHWGNDSGTVCANGTTEQAVNLAIAELVQQKLTTLSFQVDLLKEFDPRLQGYQAAALISIHNDSCDYINAEATGYKVAAAFGTRDMNRASRLSSCLTDRYGRTVPLPYHPGSITKDMTEYHAFSEIDPNTTAAIIETGFMYEDYEILTQQPDLVSQGIVNGILCFINNESVNPTPVP